VNCQEAAAVNNAAGKFAMKYENIRNAVKRIFCTRSNIVTGPNVQIARGDMTNPQATTNRGPSAKQSHLSVVVVLMFLSSGAKSWL
jgi:hypothetical protein